MPVGRVPDAISLLDFLSKYQEIERIKFDIYKNLQMQFAVFDNIVICLAG
jgi:hypothetical protein